MIAYYCFLFMQIVYYFMQVKTILFTFTGVILHSHAPLPLFISGKRISYQSHRRAACYNYCSEPLWSSMERRQRELLLRHGPQSSCCCVVLPAGCCFVGAGKLRLLVCVRFDLFTRSMIVFFHLYVGRVLFSAS